MLIGLIVLVLLSPFLIDGAHNRYNATSSPGYIMVECDEGLANRLRVLLTHLYFAKALHKGANLG
jgi:hypothetical protein